jgi:hypothetical protein
LLCFEKHRVELVAFYEREAMKTKPAAEVDVVFFDRGELCEWLESGDDERSLSGYQDRREIALDDLEEQMAKRLRKEYPDADIMEGNDYEVSQYINTHAGVNVIEAKKRHYDALNYEAAWDNSLLGAMPADE